MLLKYSTAAENEMLIDKKQVTFWWTVQKFQSITAIITHRKQLQKHTLNTIPYIDISRVKYKSFPLAKFLLSVFTQDLLVWL